MLWGGRGVRVEALQSLGGIYLKQYKRDTELMLLSTIAWKLTIPANDQRSC